MERQFSGKSFRKLWTTSRGSPLFPFGTEFAKFSYHLREPSVSRPFLTRSSKILGMECCVVNGKRHSHPVGH